MSRPASPPAYPRGSRAPCPLRGGLAPAGREHLHGLFPWPVAGGPPRPGLPPGPPPCLPPRPRLGPCPLGPWPTLATAPPEPATDQGHLLEVPRGLGRLQPRLHGRVVIAWPGGWPPLDIRTTHPACDRRPGAGPCNTAACPQAEGVCASAHVPLQGHWAASPRPSRHAGRYEWHFAVGSLLLTTIAPPGAAFSISGPACRGGCRPHAGPRNRSKTQTSWNPASEVPAGQL
jgi:hypothetical protein